MSDTELRLRPPRNAVDRRAVTWWRLQILVTAAIVVIPPFVLGLLITPARWWLWWPAFALAALAVPVLVALPLWWYHVHRWETTETAVYSRTGRLWQEWRAAPISRVQTVDVERGPLEQLVGLGTVTVTTASAKGAVKLKGLDREVAAELAERLTQVAQSVPGDAT